MIKKLLIIAFFSLNFFASPSMADEQIAEIISVEQSQDVEINIPDSVPQGFHSIVVQVTDPDTGEVSDEELLFCKDTKDEIQWDNNCPDLLASADEQPLVIEQTVIGGVTVDVVVAPEKLEGITNPDDLPNYNPISEPEKAADTQVAGFAAISVLSAGGAAAATMAGGGTSSGSSGGGSSGGGDAPGKGSAGAARNRKEEAALESAEEALHSAHARQSGRELSDNINSVAMGIGDRSFTWRAPFTDRVDAEFVFASLSVSRFAPLFGKIFIDASYLRAIFGSFSLLTMPAAIFLGIQALNTSTAQPIPPTWQIFAALAILSLLDSFAGLYAIFIYALGVFFSGNVNSFDEVLTVLAVSAIAVSPAIMAGSFRPFRRKFENGDGFWERVIDYLLASVLTAWTITGFINSLNAISGKQLAILGHSHEIGLIVGAGIVVRMLLEDLGIRLYPRRLSIFAVEFPKPSKVQQYLSITARAFIFAAVMNRFVGLNLPLLIGTVLFVIPNIAKLSIGHLLPKSRVLHFALPKGGLRIVVMTALGTVFARLGQELFTDPHSFLTWGFVLLSIPGFVLSLLTLISDDKNAGSLREHNYGKWIYRIVGVYIFYLILQIAQGKDILEVILKPFNS